MVFMNVLISKGNWFGYNLFFKELLWPADKELYPI